jgi:hypothetical protein
MAFSAKDKVQVLLLYPKTGLDLGSIMAPPHGLLAVAAPLLKAGPWQHILGSDSSQKGIDFCRNFFSCTI